MVAVTSALTGVCPPRNGQTGPTRASVRREFSGYLRGAAGVADGSGQGRLLEPGSQPRAQVPVENKAVARKVSTWGLPSSGDGVFTAPDSTGRCHRRVSPGSGLVPAEPVPEPPKSPERETAAQGSPAGGLPPASRVPQRPRLRAAWGDTDVCARARTHTRSHSASSELSQPLPPAAGVARANPTPLRAAAAQVPIYRRMAGPRSRQMHHGVPYTVHPAIAVCLPCPVTPSLFVPSC